MKQFFDKNSLPMRPMVSLGCIEINKARQGVSISVHRKETRHNYPGHYVMLYRVTSFVAKFCRAVTGQWNHVMSINFKYNK